MKQIPAFLLGLAALAVGPPVQAQATAFTYQGHLDDGANPADGIHDLQFSIYASPNGANPAAGPPTKSAVRIDNLWTHGA